jgi:hypothetical protein
MMLGRAVLRRPMVLLVRPGAVMMLGTVVPVMTLATLLIHDQSQKGVGEKGKTADRIIGKTPLRRNEYDAGETGRQKPPPR